MASLGRIVRPVLLVALSAAALHAQPFVFYRGILNAASFAPQGLPNGSIARGSIFSIFGRNLGPAQGATVSSFPLVTNFQGVSIEVCQNGNCVAAFPLFVSAAQINAIMPSNTPLGGVSVRVTFNGQTGNFSPAEIVASSVGIFAINAGGFGPGVVQNFSPNALTINSAVATARPGQTVILWGTGLGAGLNADNIAPQAGDLPVNVEIWAGNRRVTVKRYSGRSPCCAGVDQIVFDLPADTPAGCYVPIQIRTGGEVVSNTATMAVQSAGGSCSDPHNPNGEALRAGGRIGKILLRRTQTFDDSAGELVDAQIDTALGDFRDETPSVWAFNPDYSLPPVGTCLVQTRRGALIDTSPAPGTVPSIRPLDAGQELSFGSGAGTIPIRQRANGFTGYRSVLGGRVTGGEGSTLVLQPGAELPIQGAGGADVGPWQVNVTVPTAPNWTNRGQVRQIQRSAGVNITWEAGPLGGDNVWIWGGNADLTADAAVIFSCLAPGNSGAFAVPSHVLAGLPASALRASQSKGWLGVGRLSAAALRTFQATGLMSGSAGGYSQVVQTVRYR